MTTSNDMVRREEATTEHVRAEHRLTPPVDVYENTDEILLLVDVPGAERSGLSIQLDGGQLDLEARTPGFEDGEEAVVYARSFAVPNTIDPDKVEAELDMGVLTVHLPKSEAAKPRRIEVKAS